MRINVLTNKINLISINSVIQKIDLWVKSPDLVGRYICVSNVHMTMLAFDDVKFQNIINNSDLTVPDGLPLVWAQKLLGNSATSQVRGCDLSIAVCELACKGGIPIGLYGATENVIKKMESKLHEMFADINIVYSFSPPFRKLTSDETDQYVNDIVCSGAKILLVGLGCPKQETWMFEHRKSLSCVMLGVGAAFDFIAGRKKSAPRWIQKVGLEWFFRLLSDPRRLWKRYLKHNPRFIYYFILQLLGKSYIK